MVGRSKGLIVAPSIAEEEEANGKPEGVDPNLLV